MALPHPHLPAIPPLWREGRIGLEWAGLRRSDVFRGEGVPQGDGRGVLLLPGFLAGDGSLGTMTQWLRAAGWHTKRAGIRANVACSEAACTRIEERLEALAQRTGDRVAIVGQSRGGVFAKALGARRPDLVSGVIALGSPLMSQLAVHPVVLAQVGVVAALGSGPVPGLISWRCLRGDCCAQFRAALEGPFPARGRLRVALLPLGRDRRLALVPGPGRLVRRGPRVALRDEPERRRLPGDRPCAVELRRAGERVGAGRVGRRRYAAPGGPASTRARIASSGPRNQPSASTHHVSPAAP